MICHYCKAKIEQNLLMLQDSTFDNNGIKWEYFDNKCTDCKNTILIKYEESLKDYHKLNANGVYEFLKDNPNFE